LTRIVFNDRVEAPHETPSRDPLEFHRRLPDYHPSPLLHADLIARELDLTDVWIKDESTRLELPSFKILGASWGVYRALENRLGGFEPWEQTEELAVQLKPHLPLALTSATAGNHGRAVARVARLLGLEARIFVPKETTRARIEAIESEGASCEVVDGSYDDAVARAAAEASEACLLISDTARSSDEEVPRWIIEGYSTIFWESEDQLRSAGAKRPDVIVVQVGVGGLGSAAVRHFRRPDSPPVSLVAVEPEAAACVLASVKAGEVVTVPGPHASIMAGLNCGTPSLAAWPYVSSGFDGYLSIADERARDAMRMFAREQIVVGETGAAGLGGLLELLKGPRRDEAVARLGLEDSVSVLLISTEGATDPESYLEIVGQPP
jgi:diaminopropionate ammonia-lyase